MTQPKTGQSRAGKMAMTPEYEAGFDLFKREPELSVVAVWWHAQQVGYSDATRAQFVEGYVAARRQHDDYQREQKESDNEL